MSENKNTIRELYEAGLSDAEIADRIGITKHSVTRYRVNHGMTISERPADFADNAGWSVVKLKAHYRVSHQTIMKWRAEVGMKVDQRAMIKQPPENFAELYEKMHLAQIAEMFKVSEETARKWRVQLGIPRKNLTQPAPDDFVAVAAEKNLTELSGHYHVPVSTISRWAIERGIKIESNLKLKRPDDFEHNAKTYPITQLMQIYKVSRRVVRRWLDEAGIQPRQAMFRPAVAGISFGIAKPQSAARDYTIAGQASDYLKRFFAPVCKAEYSCHKGPKGSYLVGRQLMRRDDMVELACKKGFKIGDAL